VASEPHLGQKKYLPLVEMLPMTLSMTPVMTQNPLLQMALVFQTATAGAVMLQVSRTAAAVMMKESAPAAMKESAPAAAVMKKSAAASLMKKAAVPLMKSAAVALVTGVALVSLVTGLALLSVVAPVSAMAQVKQLTAALLVGRGFPSVLHLPKPILMMLFGPP